MNLEHIVCDLCHADDSRVLFEGRDRLHNLPGVFRVVQCRQCGLVYLDPRPTKDEIGAYYPQSYEPHVVDESLRKSWLLRMDYEYGLGKRRRAIERFVNRGRVLDVGCGSGSFLAYMRKHGWQVQGLDISPYAVDYAQNALGLDVVQGELPDLQYEDRIFELITMWNVFEHLYNPAATLRECRRLLKPRGLLAIAVPNLSGLGAKIFGPAWVGYDVPRHLYTYSPETLRAMLQNNGFRLHKIEFLFGSHQAYAHSLAFALQHPVDGLTAWEKKIIKIVRGRFLRLLTVLPFWLVGALGRGEIMTAFCRPSEYQIGG